MKSEWYFFSVRNEMKPARSKKRLLGELPKSL